MRPKLVQVKALMFGTVAGAFGIAHVDPDNEEAKEPFVDERAAEKLVAEGFAKLVKTKVVDDDDDADAGRREDPAGDAAAARTEKVVKAVAKAAPRRAAAKKPSRGGRKAPAKPEGTKAARPEEASGGESTRDSLALPVDVLATDTARGDVPVKPGEGGEAAEDSPPAE